MRLPTVAIAADHAGVSLKKLIQEKLQEEASFTDFGPATADRVDYPDFAEKACRAVQEGKAERAVLVCGSGIGMSIAANKLDGIRAAHAETTLTAQLAREHNNANVLCIGERITGPDQAVAMVRAWLNAKFESRHQHRIDKIHALEGK